MRKTQALGVLSLALGIAACQTPPTLVVRADGVVDTRVIGPSSVLFTDGPRVGLWVGGETRSLPDPFDASVPPRAAWVGGAEDAMVLGEVLAEWDGSEWRRTEIATGSERTRLTSAIRCDGRTWVAAADPADRSLLFVRRDTAFELVASPTEDITPEIACHDGRAMVASGYQRFVRVGEEWSEIEDVAYSGEAAQHPVDGRVVFVERIPNAAPDGAYRGPAEITLTTWRDRERVDTVLQLPLDGHTWGVPGDADAAFDFSDVEVVLGPGGDVWIVVIDRRADECGLGGCGGSGSGTVWSGSGGGGGRRMRDTRAVIYLQVEGAWSEVAIFAADEYGRVDLGSPIALAPGELSRTGEDFEDLDVRLLASAR